MPKDTLNAQELLNACVSKYSLSKIDGWNCYNFPSSLEFYGSTVMIDARNNFLIAKEFWLHYYRCCRLSGLGCVYNSRRSL